MPASPLIALESKNQPLLSGVAFAGRVGASLLISCVLIGISLLAGMAGYHHFEHMAWIDAFVNAAMILSGMGPLAVPQTWGAARLLSDPRVFA